MNIIVRNSDNVVVFSGTDLLLDATGAHGDGWTYAGLTNANATLVQNVTLPTPWIAGAYAYANGAFAVFDQAAINAVQQKTAIIQAEATYASLLAGGITLTSTGTPALNGTYSTTPTAVVNVSGIATSIANGLGLPGGGTTFNYRDASGNSHAFDSAHFLAFAAAVRDFVYHAEDAMATIAKGGTATFPSNQVTIA